MYAYQWDNHSPLNSNPCPYKVDDKKNILIIAMIWQDDNFIIFYFCF